MSGANLDSATLWLHCYNKMMNISIGGVERVAIRL